MTECFKHSTTRSFEPCKYNLNWTVILYLHPPPFSPQGCRKEEELPARVWAKHFSGIVHSCPQQVNNCCWPRRAWRPPTFSPWCSSPPSLPPGEREHGHHFLPCCFAQTWWNCWGFWCYSAAHVRVLGRRLSEPAAQLLGTLCCSWWPCNLLHTA